MSRIGKMPVLLPKNVTVTIRPGAVEVKGPKGVLSTPLPRGITCVQEEGGIRLGRESDAQQQRAFHGLTRSLLANAVKGVSEGFKRELDIVGVGYKAAVEGRKATFSLGYSHIKELAIPEGIEITVEKNTHVVVTGYDRQAVGQVAAQIRSFKKPEPYKGKGIKYSDEHIIRKAGKAAK